MTKADLIEAMKNMNDDYEVIAHHHEDTHSSGLAGGAWDIKFINEFKDLKKIELIIF